MTTMIELLKQLRQETGAGILDCRQALEQSHASYVEALSILREKAAEQAGRHADRQVSKGMVELYSHGDGRIGVMVEVNCETDFAARSEAFRTLAHEMALQIAAAAPLWVSDEEIPAEKLREQEEKAAARAISEGKPEHLVPRITAGSLEKFLNRCVLLRQVSIRDEAVTVAQIIDRAAASIGEKIVIRRFARFNLEEG